ncbi:hypothetical protein ACH5RR_003198 [Cinchona calisaya]|uniref:Uncharacterized protein n=1 Tax=Cinchona calisaya TaxID=153742 RepID=A0ABD3AU47_9GENT
MVTPSANRGLRENRSVCLNNCSRSDWNDDNIDPQRIISPPNSDTKWRIDLGFTEDRIYHGEEPWEFGQQNASNIICETDKEDDIQGLTHEAFGNINSTSAIHGIEEDFDFGLELENDVACDEETANFFKLLKHAETELYKGYKSFTFISSLLGYYI